MQVIELPAPELQGEDADQYEIIGIKSTYRLAQRPASYVILQYDRPVLKRKGSEQPLPSPAPFNVLDKSLADVSFLVGLLVDKFCHHLPLYRQHQRLTQAGITLTAPAHQPGQARHRPAAPPRRRATGKRVAEPGVGHGRNPH